MNPLLLLIGQIGRRSEKRRSLGLLLSIQDLPGDGWRQTDQSGWRSGVDVRRTPGGRRAYKTGAFVALRHFWQKSPSRALWVQLLPYATADDALDYVRKFRSTLIPRNHGVGRRNPGLVRLEEKIVDGLILPGAENAVALETLYARGDRRGCQRTICAKVGNVPFVTSGSAWGDGWDWDELITLASMQANRIRSNARSDLRET